MWVFLPFLASFLALRHCRTKTFTVDAPCSDGGLSLQLLLLLAKISLFLVLSSSFLSSNAINRLGGRLLPMLHLPKMQFSSTERGGARLRVPRGSLDLLAICSQARVCRCPDCRWEKKGRDSCAVRRVCMRRAAAAEAAARSVTIHDGGIRSTERHLEAEKCVYRYIEWCHRRHGAMTDYDCVGGEFLVKEFRVSRA